MRIVFFLFPMIAVAGSLDDFKTFVTETWSPSPQSALIVAEFIDAQKYKLDALISATDSWSKEENNLLENGRTQEADCVHTHRVSLNASTSLAVGMRRKLDEMDNIKKMTPAFFDELTRVGLITRNINELHRKLTECMLTYELAESSRVSVREVVRLGASNPVQPYNFESLSTIDPGQLPFR